ncbi:two-component system sensor histidine kinase EnvZ, partial [Erwinia amylovora]|nr:two-component system sensor histidine kinase EnvZ [Erwinia amylovora]
GELQLDIKPLSIKRANENMVVKAARYANGWINVSTGSELHRDCNQEEYDGPGIEPYNLLHHLKKLVSGESASNTSGTSLGLAIV